MNCSACGTPLTHINEPCPNCLPKMAWRPPTQAMLDRKEAKEETLTGAEKRRKDEFHDSIQSVARSLESINIALIKISEVLLKISNNT